jgi:hypothetical protein
LTLAQLTIINEYNAKFFRGARLDYGPAGIMKERYSGADDRVDTVATGKNPSQSDHSKFALLKSAPRVEQQ